VHDWRYYTLRLILMFIAGAVGGIAGVLMAEVLMVGQIWEREMLFHTGHGALIGMCAGSILGGIIRANLSNNIVGDSVALVSAMVLGFVFTAVVVLVLQYGAAA
jgi:hypothetical protein